jgi:tRNA 2-thiouridine synthesizing protein A
MSDTVDARGLSCPQPVILAKNAINKGDFPFEVLVDTTTSCENVTRMAEKNGCRVTIREEGSECMLTIDKA